MVPEIWTRPLRMTRASCVRVIRLGVSRRAALSGMTAIRRSEEAVWFAARSCLADRAAVTCALRW